MALEEASPEDGIQINPPQVAEWRASQGEGLFGREVPRASLAILEQTFWTLIESWVSAKLAVSMTGVPVRQITPLFDRSVGRAEKARTRRLNDSASNQHIVASKCLAGACGSVLYTAAQCGINRFSADLVARIGTSKIELLQVWL